MTAAVGLPTLRLIRHSIDLMDGDTALSLKGLSAGMWRAVTRALKISAYSGCLAARQRTGKRDRAKFNALNNAPGQFQSAPRTEPVSSPNDRKSSKKTSSNQAPLMQPLQSSASC